MHRLSGRIRRRRSLYDDSGVLPHVRRRSSSFSFPIVKKGIFIGGKTNVKPARRWTKVEYEWIPIGGVRKRIPGGLKDRLQKMRDRRALKNGSGANSRQDDVDGVVPLVSTNDGMGGSRDPNRRRDQTTPEAQKTKERPRIDSFSSLVAEADTPWSV